LLFYYTALTISMLKKIRWEALRSAAIDLEMHDLDDIEEVTEEMRNDDSLLRKIHHILFEVHLIEGHLVCPETSRKFPVKDGIPNMLLHEDEV
jgi:multifunctional methyltransferase subunit TRM112